MLNCFKPSAMCSSQNSTARFFWQVRLTGVSRCLPCAERTDVKIQANKLIQEIAPIVGGKGGGRPENAQGSGTDVGKIDTALAEAERLITATQL